MAPHAQHVYVSSFVGGLCGQRVPRTEARTFTIGIGRHAVSSEWQSESGCVPPTALHDHFAG